MTYTRVSIPKAEGAGAPTIKDPTVIVIPVEDIDSFPTRSLGDTALDGSIALKTGAKAIGVYATPSSISITREVSGDPDGRGFTKGVDFAHPGDSKDINDFDEATLNKGVVVLVKTCDGSTGEYICVGDPCNPLYNSGEYTNSSDGTRHSESFKQAQADKFSVARYTGTVPTLADEPAESAGA